MNRNQTIQPRTNRTAKRKGTILLVAMVLGSAMALTLGSYTSLSFRSHHLADRSFHANGALNLAEAGIELGMYAINFNDWSDWTIPGGSAPRTLDLDPMALGGGTTGEIRVMVFNYDSPGNPMVLAQGSVQPGFGSPIVKQIVVTLGRRGFFANGLVARDTIRFSGGNASVDSYDSTDPNYSTDGQYDPGKRKDNGTAASVSVDTDAITLSNADIWGFVATGGALPSVGPNGTVRGENTPAGVNVDPSRIATDFHSSFFSVDPPTTFDVSYADISGNFTIGSPGTSTTVSAQSISNNNNRTIHIHGDVTMVVTGSINIGGELRIHPDSSLTLYLHGDLDVRGNGAVNLTNLPQNFIIYGVGPEDLTRTYTLRGNGALQAAIYAPWADVELRGGGNSGTMMGSVVARKIFINGTYSFHYDEALAQVDTDNPYSISHWRELRPGIDMVQFPN
ncbi:MAG: hypothetical protein EA425_00150 [Puniceicoccaceae bacterium]|nr:MAG: hypothetical protein EA425_00150 [Puniceicoccaceae bacterium]